MNKEEKMNLKKAKQKNREEFDKKFTWEGVLDHVDNDDADDLKSFLSQAEDRIIEALREELDEEIKSYVEEGDYAGADTLKFFRQKVKGKEL